MGESNMSKLGSGRAIVCVLAESKINNKLLSYFMGLAFLFYTVS